MNRLWRIISGGEPFFQFNQQNKEEIKRGLGEISEKNEKWLLYQYGSAEDSRTSSIDLDCLFIISLLGFYKIEYTPVIIAEPSASPNHQLPILVAEGDGRVIELPEITKFISEQSGRSLIDNELGQISLLAALETQLLQPLKYLLWKDDSVYESNTKPVYTAQLKSMNRLLRCAVNKSIRNSMQVEAVEEAKIISVTGFLIEQIVPILQQQSYLSPTANPNILDAMLYSALKTIQSILPKNHDWNVVINSSADLNNYLTRIDSSFE